MRRASTLAVTVLAAAGGLLLADAAVAQSAAGAAPRYLSWQGRGEAAEASPTAQPVASSRRPNTVIPHGGFATAQPPRPRLTPAPGPVRHSLTPANAWLRPAASPPPEAAPAASIPAPQPAGPRPSAPAPQRPVVPEYLPDQGGRGQPAPAEVVYPETEAASDAAGLSPDPMAPRRDAPIFRMRQDAPQPQPAPAAPPRAEPATGTQPAPQRIVEVVNSGEEPARQGARYYSVHRQNGREPDALVMPAPTYVDALVVSMTETPATQDLAEPAQGPTLIRDRNGNMRATPAASDGDHQ